MLEWIVDHSAFFYATVGLVIGALASYWKMEKRLALLETNMSNSFELLQKSFSDQLEHVRNDLSRLEKKQDKYNNLQERTLRVELNHASLDSRVSRLENNLKN